MTERSRLSRRLKLQQLRLLVAIADRGSLLQASGVLGLTQPALTRALRELELLVGAQLFERHNKGVLVTPAGELLLKSARRILAELSDCDHRFDQYQGSQENWVSVGALAAAAAGLLPAVLTHLHRQTSRLQVRVVQGHSDELLAALGAGDVDLIVGRLYLDETDDDFERVVLYDDVVTLIARSSHPLFDSSEPPLSQLHRYPLALPTRTPVAEVLEFLQRFRLTQSVSLESNSMPLIRELLLSSNTITLVPRMMLAGDLLRGTVREIAALPAPGGRPCGLIRRRDVPLSPHAARFAQALQQQVQQLGLPAASGPISGGGQT